MNLPEPSPGEISMSVSSASRAGNLFRDLPALATGESFEEILASRHVRIERIVSSDRPEPTLYDQDADEWICLLQGEAELWIAGEIVPLHSGDHRLIPAHTPHRVCRTSTHPPCIWLAVHLSPSAPAIPRPAR
jgi:cupin 2 domain-containing protein